MIQFEQVHYEINNQIVLQNITGTIHKQRITSFIGPSGAGKTTLLKMCNALSSPTKGNILIDGQNVNDIVPTVLRKKVGIALQNAPIVSGTVYDNLALPAKIHKAPFHEEDALHLLQQVSLPANVLKKNAADLSGGQRQRLSIARTLVNKPDVLLLDEITSALDPIAAHGIEQLILSINKNYGVTIVWVTHNLEQARTLSDDTWFFVQGQLVLAGETTQLFASTDEQLVQFLRGGAQ